MKIYISHSSDYDYSQDLYLPIKSNKLSKKHTFYLPHDEVNAGVDARPFIKKCDLIIADVSYPSTGQGIELGWASDSSIPILCIYKMGSKVSSSLKFVTTEFIEYSDADDMLRKLERHLNGTG